MNPSILIYDDGKTDPMYVATKEGVKRSLRTPPCVCNTCHDAYYYLEDQRSPSHSYHHRISDEEAKRRASSMATKLDECRASLKSLIEVYADVLASRWRKRSQAKREALLKEAAPDLEEERWLVPRYFYMREKKCVHSRSPKRRRQLLLPWLNVEALKTNPMMLFALLHYRSAYHPQDWAEFDSRQLDKGWQNGWFDVDYNAKCIVLYGPKYGSLVNWEEKAVHRSDIIGYPRGILVLEAQAYLMEVLCSIAEKILEGLDTSQPPRNQKWRDLIERAAFQEKNTVEFWSPYLNQAFSAPPRFDVTYLISLAKSRLDETGDHLQFLQYDPAYLRRHLKICLASAALKKATDEQKATYLTGRIRAEVMNNFWWRSIEEECKHVDALRRELNVHPQSGTPLPVSYDQAIGALEGLLISQVTYRAEYLWRLVPFIPGLQKNWEQAKPADKSYDAPMCIKRKTFHDSQKALSEDPLEWCLIQLKGIPDYASMFHPEMLCAMIQEHLCKNPSEATRLDEVTYQALSDPSTCHEMLLALRFHRPRSIIDSISELEKTGNRQFWKWRHSGIETSDFQPYVRIGLSLINGFYRRSPPTGSRNAAWLAHSQELRTCVENFWDSMRDKIIRPQFKSSQWSREEVDDIVAVISVHSTEEYQRENQEEADTILADTQRDQPEAVVGFSGHGEDNAIRTTIPIREKTKTRGEPGISISHTAPSLEDAATAPTGIADEVQASPIVVSQSSLDVFQLMFPEKDGAAKEVLWDRFVHAMVDAGFTARNNSGGSAVSFRNPDSAGGRIVFHKPHPVAKMDPVLLQVMGKRMAKWFGWRRELFQLQGDVK